MWNQSGKTNWIFFIGLSCFLSVETACQSNSKQNKPAPAASKPAASLRKPSPMHKLASAPAKPAAANAALPKPVTTAAAKPTPAGGDDDWETF